MHTEEQKKFYMTQTSALQDDVSFYNDFIGQHEALELFAGFGRVTNRLIAKGHSLESVEIDPFYARHIDLPTDRNHVYDVLNFQSNKEFQRIFAAYNSIPLIHKPKNIRQFFRAVSELLAPGGQLALNVYDVNYWQSVAEYDFMMGSQSVRYQASFDLSNRENKTVQWIDLYTVDDQTISIPYTLRVYESPEDFEPFLSNTSLECIAVTPNFGRPVDELVEPGFIDYIFVKH